MKRNVGMKEGSVYELDGRVPLKKALPLGIQHVLAMLLGNVSPLLIVCGLPDIAPDRENGADPECANVRRGDRNAAAAVPDPALRLPSADRHGKRAPGLSERRRSSVPLLATGALMGAEHGRFAV